MLINNDQVIPVIMSTKITKVGLLNAPGTIWVGTDV